MRRFVVALAMAAVAVTSASCGSDGAGKAAPKVVELVVPAGTQDRLDRGEVVEVMPAKLEFRVGDTLRIRNDDDTDQYVGPYLVLAGRQFELRYGKPGRFTGLCDLSGGASYEIVITK